MAVDPSPLIEEDDAMIPVSEGRDVAGRRYV